MGKFCPSGATYLSSCTRLENKRLHGTLMVRLYLGKACPRCDGECYCNDRNDATHEPLTSLYFRMSGLFPIVGLPIPLHYPIGADENFVYRNWRSRCTRLVWHLPYVLVARKYVLQHN